MFAVTETGQPTESVSAITWPKFSTRVGKTKAVAWEKMSLLASGVKDSLRDTVTLKGSWVGNRPVDTPREWDLTPSDRDNSGGEGKNCLGGWDR